MKETSRNSLAVFTRFSCKKAKITLETSASVLCTAVNSLRGPREIVCSCCDLVADLQYSTLLTNLLACWEQNYVAHLL